MSTQDARLQMMNALLRKRGADEASRADLRAFAAEHGVQGDDLDAIEAVGAERFLVYRSLVQNRMRNTIADFIERTAARLGMKRLRADFADWMDQCAARSPYLRDVPAEFVAWVTPRWREDDAVPDYLVDLARHELLEYDIRNDHRGGESPTGRDLALDKPLRFDGAARLMTYDYAVHKLSSDAQSTELPEHTPSRLLVYRDPDAKVRYLELTTLAHAVLVQLIEHRRPVADGLRAACESCGEPLDDDRLAIAATLLSDLAERGVLLGAEA
ncbi:MAG: putative DNA-binding domain-containing protein [Nannocystaceae bacterium]|nr:putative DNA-binding domain-containing protein [bacterium]